MTWRCRSRRVGAVLAVSLGTALDRGGQYRRIGMPCGDLAIDIVPVERAVGGEGGNRARDPVEQGPTCAPSSAAWPVSADATIRPVSASVARCSFFQDRRIRCHASRPATRRGRRAFQPAFPGCGANLVTFGAGFW